MFNPPELTDAEKGRLGKIVDDPSFKKLLEKIEMDQIETVRSAMRMSGETASPKIAEACAILGAIEKIYTTMMTYIGVPANS